MRVSNILVTNVTIELLRKVIYQPILNQNIKWSNKRFSFPKSTMKILGHTIPRLLTCTAVGYSLHSVLMSGPMLRKSGTGPITSLAASGYVFLSGRSWCHHIIHEFWLTIKIILWFEQENVLKSLITFVTATWLLRPILQDRRRE